MITRRLNLWPSSRENILAVSLETGGGDVEGYIISTSFSSKDYYRG